MTLPSINSKTNLSEDNNFNHSCHSQIGGTIMNCAIETLMHSGNHSISSLDKAQDQDDHHDFNFAIDPHTLAEIVETNDGNFLEQCGGLQQIVAALETDTEMGINGDIYDLHRRLEAFDSNQYSQGQPSPVTNTLFQFSKEALKDTTFILLLCYAALSLVIGIKRNGPQEGFLDGALIFLAILGVISFGAICKYVKSKWVTRKVKKQKKMVCVVRQGKLQKISASEVVVGDIVCLEKGNEVPADGLFIHGNSSLELGCDVGHKAPSHFKCNAMFSGSIVAEDCCRMLVISVGKNTERRKLMRLLKNQQTDRCDSKLQTAIDKIRSNMENLGLVLSLIVLVVQVFRCFVWESECDDDHDPDPKGMKNTMEEIMNEVTRLVKKESVKVNGLVPVLCVLVFELRNFLPLGIFTTFLYASKKIKSVNAMVRKLPACATLGLITTICLGKTDDLTLQYTKMADLWIGMKLIHDVSTEVDELVLKPLQKSIYLTNSCDLAENIALLLWAKQVLGVDANRLQNNCAILQSEAVDLNGSHCRMVVTQEKEESNNKVEVQWKVAPEPILSMCSYYVDVNGAMKTLDEEKRALFRSILGNVSSDSLQCFAFASKQVKQEEKEEEEEEKEEEWRTLKPDEIKEAKDDGEKTTKDEERGLTLLGAVCMKNPYGAETSEALKSCLQIGVKIKLVVDDDINTAKVMALHSGILRPEEDDVNQAVIEASVFRNSSEEDRKNMMDNVHVLANASPIDKFLMVQCLREKANVVAATSACIRDLPSLQEADVGLFMADHCAETSHVDADILVLGPNVAIISTLVRFGGCVCNSLEKLIQLQMTMNITAFTINFILEISRSQVQFTTFQLLWMNFIMDVLGALALATQTVKLTPPLGHQIEQSRPVSGGGASPIITNWINIAAQSLYQVILIVMLSMNGKSILHVDDDMIRSMMFICYVLCQVFALLGNLRMRKPCTVEGFFTFNNYLFLSIVGIIMILQVGLVEIMAITAHWRKLNLKGWCISTAIAALPGALDYAVSWVRCSLIRCLINLTKLVLMCAG